MKATCLIPAIPFTAAAAGFIFLVALRFKRVRWAALALYTFAIPTLAILCYRFWDHYVGPDTFSIWQFHISPASISFLLPLAVVSPLLLWATETTGPVKKSRIAASAMSCFGLAAALAAVMTDHLFLLSGMFALATWCMAGGVILRGRKAGRLLPFLFPLGLADLCLVLGVLFLYLSDPTRGLFFPAAPLRPSGMLAVSCALMLAAALLRLGCLPFHRWMTGMSQGGKDLRLVHLLAVDLALGTFLLFTVSRIFFVWDGVWVWVCMGVAGATLVALVRELLHASGREETWGLICAALGAGLALTAAPGGQAAAAAARLGLWAGVPALALVELGSEGRRGMAWARVAGGASLLGLPPLAGFAWLWMGFSTLEGEFEGGVTVIFLAAIPVLFATALVMGTAALLLPKGGDEKTPVRLAAASALLLTAYSAALGLYPGTAIDLLMREYGLPLDIPFSSWTALGWAVLICCGLGVIIAAAWTHRRGEKHAIEITGHYALPLLASKRVFSLTLLDSRRARGAAVLSELLIYLAWIAAMVYLGVK
jgi:formate hydrogenlyase subunit 3/multisubunit Na+/H+ antiporter MnhD subunit